MNKRRNGISILHSYWLGVYPLPFSAKTPRLQKHQHQKTNATLLRAIVDGPSQDRNAHTENCSHRCLRPHHRLLGTSHVVDVGDRHDATPKESAHLQRAIAAVLPSSGHIPERQEPTDREEQYREPEEPETDPLLISDFDRVAVARVDALVGCEACTGKDLAWACAICSNVSKNSKVENSSRARAYQDRTDRSLPGFVDCMPHEDVHSLLRGCRCWSRLQKFCWCFGCE